MQQDFANVLENIRVRLYSKAGVFDPQLILDQSVAAYRDALDGGADSKTCYAQLQEFLFGISESMDARSFNEYVRKLQPVLNRSTPGGVERHSSRLALKLRIFRHMFKEKRFRFFAFKYVPFNIKHVRNIYYLLACGLTRGSKIFYYNLRPNHLYLDYLQICITTKCTLRCNGCSNLMHLYEKPEDQDEALLMESIRKLDECTDRIGELCILGGEPFCNPKLKEYLKAIPTGKCDVVKVLTNCTILPKDEELLAILKEKKIRVSLSDYGPLSRRINEIEELFKREGIRYFRHPRDRHWLDVGEVKDYHRSEKELVRQFGLCTMKMCKDLVDGAIYYCPRSSHGHKLGLTPRLEGEYVELCKNDRKENIRQLKKLYYRTKYLNACHYCKEGTADCGIIPMAEQCPKRKGSAEEEPA